MILTPSEMQTLEQRAFATGAVPEALMEEAGAQMAAAVMQFCPKPGACLAVFGKGHNGGDALVAARALSSAGWKVTLLPAFPDSEWAPLTRLKWQQAGLCETRSFSAMEGWRPPAGMPWIILDGLLGIGAQGPLRPPVDQLCRFINASRQHSNAIVFALDIPTGLNGTTGVAENDAVIADVTLTVGFPKTGLLADGAEAHVGRLAVMDITAFSAVSEPSASLEYAVPKTLARLWKRRPAQMHKGDAGRVTIVAGAVGTVGAAVLAARGALRAGAGLVTLCVPESIYAIAAALAPLECMVKPLRTPSEALALPCDALGIGPGLGQYNPDAIREVIQNFSGHAVVDADALNVLAKGDMHILEAAKGPRLLTPHPGEMQRLAPGLSALPRMVQVAQFTERWPVSLLLKGNRTLTGTRHQGICANTTGNPGMASGGMGDVLTGVCAALLAQKLSCHEAGVLGAWLCGRAAELVVSAGHHSTESLLASDVADALGGAFDALRENSF